MVSTQPERTHRGIIRRFADADTVVVLVEGSFGHWSELYLRLEGIESYELRGPHRADAQGIRNILNADLFNEPCLVHFRTYGHDRYGRLRGCITVRETDLAGWLVTKGYAWHVTVSESRRMHRGEIPNVPQPRSQSCPVSEQPPSSPSSSPSCVGASHS